MAGWEKTSGQVRQFFNRDGSGKTSKNNIRALVSGLGVEGNLDSLLGESGAISGDQVDVEKFLAYLRPSAGLAPASSGECRMRIFHINDVYELDNFPQLMTCIKKLSEGIPEKNILRTLAGDFLAPSLLSSIDHGRSMVTVMNDLSIDAVCFGNHEVDVPHNSLMSRINEFKGKWLNSNMRSYSGEKGLKEGALVDNHLIQLEGGRSVALIGLLAGGGRCASLYRDGAFHGHAAKITPVLDAVDDAFARAKAAYPKADCVIPLTHQDMSDDLEMTRVDTPVILGGHDHAIFNETKNGTLIIKAGADCFNCAVIDLVWAAGAPPGPPTSVSAELVPLALPKKYKGPPVELKYEPDPALLEHVNRLHEPADELREAVLSNVEPGKFTSIGVRAGEASMATLICSAMRDVVECDGTMINAAGVRGKKFYETGVIGFADMSAECPFPTANIVVPMDGATISAAVQKSRLPWLPDGPPGPRGEKGESGEALQFDDGMKVDPATMAVVEIGGKPIVLEKMYNILIDSFLMQQFPVLKEYSAQFPERIPPDDSGQAALPMLVQYFCDKVWMELIDQDNTGVVHIHDIEKFFEEADTNKSGDIGPEELFVVLNKRKPGMARVIASQCLGYADANKDGKISKKELVDFLQAEACEHQHEHDSTHWVAG